ncbi:MAG: biotin--[acetyl-CoA-carboxylase] ligase [Limnochordales bacterium]|nr:biotin--[acetyl-CoA-carboxylase] ligase [Limnochordales bacterium]
MDRTAPAGDTAARVLARLQAGEGEYVSGQELAASLQVSRTSVWKAVRRLREQGCVIEGSPRRGYRLVFHPLDTPAPEQVLPGLTTRLLRRLVYLPVTASTNEVAKAQAREGAPEGTVIVAERQTHGRGRRGRGWASPPGRGLWFSVLLRPEIPPRDAPLLALLAAAAVREAVAAVGGIDVQIKWPNDVVAGDAKLCGILVEMDAELERVRHCVVGIGVNVNQAAEDFPPELRAAATSVRILAGRPVPRVPLLQAILQALETRYLSLASAGFGPLLAEVRRCSATLGRPVRVLEARGQAWDGRAVAILDDGSLLVEPAGGGPPRAVYAADVSVRRRGGGEAR